jgi:hypothetical protein
MTELVFFLEEASAKAMLEVLVPRLAPPGAAFHLRCVVFEGKQDLERNLEQKLRGYLTPNAKFFVLRDQDREDCRKLKQRLKKICVKAKRPATVVRIACRELESFYLGDLRAVEKALGLKNLARRQSTEKFRDPDQLQNPAAELESLTGYIYQKVGGSRAIAAELNPHQSRSKSYLQLVTAITAALPVK